MNFLISFISSLFLIYSFYYSIFNQNNLLAVTVVLVTLAVIPYTAKNLALEKNRFFFWDPRIFFAFLILVEVLLLSFNYVLPSYKEKLDQVYLYFLVAAILFFILNYKEKLEFLLEKYKINTKLIFLISLAFSFYLWGGNLKANWGLIDDQMVMEYFIDNPQVTFWQVPGIILGKTEVGKFGNTTINRPFFYAGRVLESALWQRNVSFWYLARIAMFAVSFFLFWILLERWLGFFYSGIFMFFVALSSYWAWIWGYLGPAENYAMFGSALFLTGFLNLVDRIKKKTVTRKSIQVNSAILLLGSLIAIGSKENFLVLIVPLFYLVFLLFRKRIKDWFLISSLVTIFIYSAIIATGIYLGLAKAGGDVYGQGVGFAERWNLTYINIAAIFEKIGIPGVLWVVLFSSVVIFLTKNKDSFVRYANVLKNFFFTSFLLLALYASQVFFYNGDFPSASLRYSFPGMLAIPLFWLVALATLFSIFEILGWNPFLTKQTKNAIFAGLLVLILLNGYQDARAFVADNVAVTNSFTTKMESFYSILKANPQEPILFEPSSVWNVEPIASVRIYLLANGVKNSMFLKLKFSLSAESSQDKITAKIYTFLRQISENGGCGFTGAQYAFLSGGDCAQWGFEPLSKLSREHFTIKIDEKNEISGFQNR